MIVGYYDGEQSLCNQGEKQLCAAGLTRGGEQFKGLEVDACLFVNLPEKKRTQWPLTKEEMKDLYAAPTSAGRPDRVRRTVTLDIQTLLC